MIRSVNTCTNCKNLVNNFKCEKHNKDVDLNSSDAHVTKSALSEDLHVLIAVYISFDL